jgi:hypothetical protein
MIVILTVAVLNLANTPPGVSSQVDSNQPATVAPAESEKDLAASINESIDSSEIRLSPKMFRAIEAVEKYRLKRQRRQLSRAELDLENFNITVSAKDHHNWLPARERGFCYIVVLAPRFRPGEVVAFDRHASIGRASVYGVRRSGYEVVAAQVGERPPVNPALQPDDQLGRSAPSPARR